MAKSPVLYRTVPQHSLNWHWPYSAGIGDPDNRDFQKALECWMLFYNYDFCRMYIVILVSRCMSLCLLVIGIMQHFIHLIAYIRNGTTFRGIYPPVSPHPQVSDTVVSLLQLRNVAQLIGKGTCRFYSQCFVGQLPLCWLWLPWCRPPLSCHIDLQTTLEVFANTASYLYLHVSLKKTKVRNQVTGNSISSLSAADVYSFDGLDAVFSQTSMVVWRSMGHERGGRHFGSQSQRNGRCPTKHWSAWRPRSYRHCLLHRAFCAQSSDEVSFIWLRKYAYTRHA